MAFAHSLSKRFARIRSCAVYFAATVLVVGTTIAPRNTQAQASTDNGMITPLLLGQSTLAIIKKSAWNRAVAIAVHRMHNAKKPHARQASSAKKSRASTRRKKNNNLSIQTKARSKNWHLSYDGFVALGIDSLGDPASGYAASGIDMHGLNDTGHGGFVRFESGDTQWINYNAGTKSIVALDIGYTFGQPILGSWDKGLIGFVELGISSWHATPLSRGNPQVIHPQGSRTDGFGVALGATLETRLKDLRVGIALNRRQLSWLTENPTEPTLPTTTLQLRVGGNL